MKKCEKRNQEILPGERSYDACKTVTFPTEPCAPPSPRYECWVCKQEQTGNPAYTSKSPAGDYNYCFKCWNHEASELIEAKDGYKDMLKTTITERDEALKALAEAQQWIDSEPDWKDKYNANFKLLSDERDQLAADNLRLRGALKLMTDTLMAEPDHPRFIRVKNSKGLITLDIFNGGKSDGNAYYVMDEFWSDILKAKEALSTPPQPSVK